MFSQALADAVYHTVHDNGGPTVLGPRLGLKPHVLSNKANPQQRHNKLSLEEALELQIITGDHRILRAEARELGHLLIPLHNPPSSDVELLTLYAGWQRDTGRTHGAIAAAFEDQVITPTEQAEIERCFFAAASAGMTYIRRMGGLVQ